MKKYDNDVVCVKFDCDSLDQYIDSMLFDSETNIATGVFEYEGKSTSIYLRVRGEVNVRYKDDLYKRPSKFPDELINRIKQNPNNWDIYAPSGEGNDDCNGDIYISSNNWFEYIYDTDGEVFEDDLSKVIPERIKQDMLIIARCYFGIINTNDTTKLN